MKKKILSLVLTCLLVVSAIPAALAADPANMTDISGHWAEEHIIWAMEQGHFNGTTETTFAPEAPMTRAMFVTVLGRMAGVDKEQYQYSSSFTDVEPQQYYAPYVNWAVEKGITTGTGDFTFSPGENITRQQLATFIVRYANAFSYDFLPVTDTIVDSFTDENAIDDYAKGYVEILRTTGLLSGISNNDGTYAFAPRANAKRAECATIFRRMDLSLTPTISGTVEPTSVSLSESSFQLAPGGAHLLSAIVEPENCTDSSVTWLSSDPSVATVDEYGLVTYAGPGTATIYAYTHNSLSASCTVTCTDSYIASAQDSTWTKYVSVFGEALATDLVEEFGFSYSTPRKAYATAAEAKSHMVTIGVKVWDFADSTQTTKITRTLYLDVHENIAATVIQIFDEIYQCDAQYPIKYVGGYRWAGYNSSEHSVGLAIDINPDENYYCDRDGNALTGKYFDPENDPYSMPIDGEIQQIFKKYGFTRGIYWSSGKKDYMHYSFFGS